MSTDLPHPFLCGDDEEEFSEENALLNELEKGNLYDPYDLGGPGGRAFPIEGPLEARAAEEQQSMELQKPAGGVAEGTRKSPLVSTGSKQQPVEPIVVRKDTCPNDCGFEGDPNAVFDHRSVCLKGQDKLSARVTFYRPPHDVSGGRSGGDRPSHLFAKKRLAVHKKRQKAPGSARHQEARSLKATGRKSTDTFQPNEGSHNHYYGSEDRHEDEQTFAEDNSLLHVFENGRLLNPYDLTGSGVHVDEIQQPAGGAAAGARPRDPRRDPRLGPAPPPFTPASMIKKRRKDCRFIATPGIHMRRRRVGPRLRQDRGEVGIGSFFPLESVCDSRQHLR